MGIVAEFLLVILHYCSSEIGWFNLFERPSAMDTYSPALTRSLYDTYFLVLTGQDQIKILTITILRAKVNLAEQGLIIPTMLMANTLMCVNN